ncbi:MAG: UDP-N-acetylglucosamine 2-epimerase (non-hydrolyzing) [Bacteroidetes bacterium]|jgi:UDP-N-acetylglucosamine 2-epimerase (non-hydrolysing)|nr:UDP-N-acetylglucosamine 2-epimerase (non-hydrolyzing) [Bacteroidota bacterium]
MNRLKVATFIGTRPEIIRLSRVMAILDKYVDQSIIHTGQNYDYELNEIFFRDLELRKPDIFLEADRSSMGAAVGDIIRKSEGVLKKIRPDAMLVLGDTNSCLSAYIAKRLHIPVFHMEAGNRSYDFNVPEEVNRRIIDHIADFNLVYTEHARRNLASEGLPHRRIYLTGSPMREVLDYYRPGIDASDILNKLGLQRKNYFLVSTHREENVDSPARLKKILSSLEILQREYNVPVIVSTHPRTRNRIEELEQVKNNSQIRFLKPFGFLDYNRLQLDSLCTLSDSGTISEESAILSFPAVSIRESMERPEAQDAGTIILSGFDPDIIRQSVNVAVDEQEEGPYTRIADDYTIQNTSMRVLKLMLGNTGLSNKWHGIIQN